MNFKRLKSMKTKTSLILVLLISCFGIMNISSFANEEIQLPSTWAREITVLARAEGIVADDINSSFSTNIKRDEFASLANRLYKRFGKTVNVTVNYPFSDMDESYYKTDVVEAFNAKLIDGVGNSQFNPKGKITRQEVAKILVTLIKNINPTEKTESSRKFSFEDSKDIASWAYPFVEYCYEKSIIKGTKELFIEPNSFTTREQAIALVYRLIESDSLKKLLPDNRKKDVDIYKVDENLPAFEKTLGKNVADVVRNYKELFKDNKYLESVEAYPEKVIANFQVGDYLDLIQVGVNNYKYDKRGKRFTISMNTSVTSNKEIYQAFDELLKTTAHYDIVKPVYEKAIYDLNQNGYLEEKVLDLGDSMSFKAFSYETVNGMGIYMEYVGPKIN